MRKLTSSINFSLKTAICYETCLLYHQLSFKDKAENLKKVVLIFFNTTLLRKLSYRWANSSFDIGDFAASSHKNIPKFVFCCIQELTSSVQ